MSGRQTFIQNLFVLAGIALMGYGCRSIHPGLGYIFGGAMLAVLAAKWYDGR